MLWRAHRRSAWLLCLLAVLGCESDGGDGSSSGFGGFPDEGFAGFGGGDGSVCPSHTRTAQDAIQATLDGFDFSCISDEDCVRVAIDTDCTPGCSVVVATDEQPDLVATVEAQNRGACAGFVEAGCEDFFESCPPPFEAACVDGFCREVFSPVGPGDVMTPFDAGTGPDPDDGDAGVDDDGGA